MLGLTRLLYIIVTGTEETPRPGPVCHHISQDPSSQNPGDPAGADKHTGSPGQAPIFRNVGINQTISVILLQELKKPLDLVLSVAHSHISQDPSSQDPGDPAGADKHSRISRTSPHLIEMLGLTRLYICYFVPGTEETSGPSPVSPHIS